MNNNYIGFITNQFSLDKLTFNNKLLHQISYQAMEGESIIRSTKRCNVCIQNYNLQNKKPLFICYNHHTICQQCYDSMNQKKCPFCRDEIEKPIENNYIQQLLTNEGISCYQKMCGIFSCCTCFLKCTLQCETKIKSDAQGFTIIIFVIQFPFLLFDLIAGINGSGEQCLDTYYYLPIIVVRPWFLFMGIFRLTCIILYLAFMLLRILKGIQSLQFKKFETCLILIWIYVQSSWMIIEILLFTLAISQHCNGGIFAYGLILTIIHSLLIILIIAAIVLNRVDKRSNF